MARISVRTFHTNHPGDVPMSPHVFQRSVHEKNMSSLSDSTLRNVTTSPSWAHLGNLSYQVFETNKVAAWTKVKQDIHKHKPTKKQKPATVGTCQGLSFSSPCFNVQPRSPKVVLEKVGCCHSSLPSPSVWHG